jgi:hypothetical protein
MVELSVKSNPSSATPVPISKHANPFIQHFENKQLMIKTIQPDPPKNRSKSHHIWWPTACGGGISGGQIQKQTRGHPGQVRSI